MKYKVTQALSVLTDELARHSNPALSSENIARYIVDYLFMIAEVVPRGWGTREARERQLHSMEQADIVQHAILEIYSEHGIDFIMSLPEAMLHIGYAINQCYEAGIEFMRLPLRDAAD